jgi:hypothetical protein
VINIQKKREALVGGNSPPRPSLSTQSNNGADVITTANNTSGVTSTGDETGLDGHQIGLSLELGDGDSRYGSAVYTVGENGAWSANASHFPFDGIYNATAFAPEQRHNFLLFVIFA